MDADAEADKDLVELFRDMHRRWRKGLGPRDDAVEVSGDSSAPDLRAGGSSVPASIDETKLRLVHEFHRRLDLRKRF
jgi:hypothetical protein